MRTERVKRREKRKREMKETKHSLMKLIGVFVCRLMYLIVGRLINEILILLPYSLACSTSTSCTVEIICDSHDGAHLQSLRWRDMSARRGSRA